jgi:purine-cytosine permease-like protein
MFSPGTADAVSEFTGQPTVGLVGVGPARDIRRPTVPENDHQRPAGMEVHTVDWVPETERHGRVFEQALFWFQGNALILTPLIGAVGALGGLNLMASLVAIALGSVVGTLFMCLHAIQGPKLGLPQIIQSRVQFGSYGAILISLVALLISLGYAIFEVRLAADSIGQLTSPHLTAYTVLVAGIALVIAVVGYDLVHKTWSWLAWASIANFLLLTIAAITAGSLAGVWSKGAFSWAPFLAEFGAAVAYQVSYAPIVSDFTRYLKPDVRNTRLVLAVGAGSLLSAVWLEGLGAAITTALPKADLTASLKSIGDGLFPGLGKLTLLVAVLALVTNVGGSVYSMVIQSITMAGAFRRIRASARLRLIACTVVAVILLFLTLALPSRYDSALNTFLVLVGYGLFPWTAVNLADFYIVRHGRYSITDIVRPDGGIYGRWGRQGLTAYAIALLCMVPFFSTAVWTGPVAKSLGGADLSPLVGVIVGALAYYLMMRNYSLDSELDALQADTAARAAKSAALT